MRHVFARSRFAAAAAALAVCALTATMFASTPAYADATDPSAESPSSMSTAIDTAADSEAEAAAGADAAPAPTPTDALATPESTDPDSASNGQAATPESIEPNGVSSDHAAPESSETATGAAQPFAALSDVPALADISALAAGGSDQCVYANASGGQYADALCWLDLSYIDSAGQKAPITTQWVQTAGPTTTAITAAEFATEAICPSAYRVSSGNGSDRPNRRTTITFESVLGATYGSATFVGCARASSAQTAADNSVTQATNAVSATLYVTGGTYYGGVTNYPLSVSLSGGAYTFTANLSITAPVASSGRAVRAVKFPSWSGAYLGNSIYEVPAAIRNTVYPALYQAAGAAMTTATLSDIQITRAGVAFAGYSIVVADAESTDNGESIRWTQSGGQGFRWLPNDPTAFSAATTTSNAARKTAAVGNACAGTNANQWPSFTPPSASDITCSAGTNQPSPKTGTAMLQALPPANGAGFSVTQEMTGRGLQAVAFGVLMARASVTVNVADRVVDATGAATVGAFDASMTHPGGTVTAQTGATGLAATQQLELPVNAAGMQLNFATTTAAPSASSYTIGWVCTKTGSGGSSRWPTSGSSATAPPTNDTWFLLQAGQFIPLVVHCRGRSLDSR